MAQQRSLSPLSEAERFVVLEHVMEYISDISTLMSLTLVSKRTRSAVYKSNGLREITLEEHFVFVYKAGCVYLKLNEVNIRGGSSYNFQVGTIKEKLQDVLRWVWTIGKCLKTIKLAAIHILDFHKIVISVLDSLAKADKRRIETIEIRDAPCWWAFNLVRENRNTLRCLCVELVPSRQSLVKFAIPTSTTHPESQAFWSIVRQCERLESLEISLDANNCSVPFEFWAVLYELPLKHLSLRTGGSLSYDDQVREKFIEVLSGDNLRHNLQSLSLDCLFFHMFFGGTPTDLIGPRLSAAFMNVKKLTFPFASDFYRNPINWPLFWSVFPAVSEIKISSENGYFYPESNLTYNLRNFCKTYFEGSESRVCKMNIESRHKCRTDAQKLIVAVASAASFSDDLDWCISHGVRIETNIRDDLVLRKDIYTLRKDTSMLVLVFEYKCETCEDQDTSISFST